MFELLMVACVGAHFCQYVAVPVQYETRQVCARQAAITAGRVKGRYHPSDSLSYAYRCRPAGSDKDHWVTVGDSDKLAMYR